MNFAIYNSHRGRTLTATSSSVYSDSRACELQMLEGGLAVLRFSLFFTKGARPRCRELSSTVPLSFPPRQFFMENFLLSYTRESRYIVARRLRALLTIQRASIECRKARSESLRCDLIKRNANVSDTSRKTCAKLRNFRINRSIANARLSRPAFREINRARNSRDQLINASIKYSSLSLSLSLSSSSCCE